MPRYAVIDVGTNSVKFNISDKREDGSWKTVVDRAEITRLGEGLEKSGEISPDAIARTVAAICAMASEARENEVAAIAAVGTMGMRTARNSEQFIGAVQQRCGVAIEVIAGDEEGRLAYLAVKSGLGLTEGSLAIFDSGGGSTQFTFGRGSAVDERFSLNVGAVRYTEQYGLSRSCSSNAASGRAGRNRCRSCPAWYGALARRPGRDGRHGHEHHGGKAQAREI